VLVLLDHLDVFLNFLPRSIDVSITIDVHQDVIKDGLHECGLFFVDSKPVSKLFFIIIAPGRGSDINFEVKV